MNNPDSSLFLLFVYPTVVILLFAVYKWRDDRWVMSNFVRDCLAICMILITALFCALIRTYSNG